MKTISFTPKGVCSKKIEVTLDDSDNVSQILFHGGCAGNTSGVAALCKGRPAKEVVEMLKGISCGAKPTSCPDQLSLALLEALKQ